MLVVQHIACAFLPARMVEETDSLRVQVAADAVPPLPGTVYLAPDAATSAFGGDGAWVLSHGAPENHVRPAICHLFRFLAESTGGACAPRRTIVNL